MAAVFDLLSSAVTSTATKLQSKLVADHIERTDPGGRFGSLWEPNENVNNCRGCGSFFPVALMKHHCRSCAGVFCDDCTQYYTEMEGYTEPVRCCEGCFRGEVPGSMVKSKIRAFLDTPDHGTIGLFANPQKAQKKIAAKFVEVLGVSVGTKPAEMIKLSRGAKFSEGSGSSIVYAEFPKCGYFEFINKSLEVVCVKVILSGGNTKFEVPRPSYTAVLPGGIVHGEFDASATDSIELLLLTNNKQHPLYVNGVNQCPGIIFFDTRSPNATANKISEVAKVSNFMDISIFVIPAHEKNVLIKYKTSPDHEIGGVITPRNGNTMSRIGFFAKMSGQRGANGVFDYSNNITEVTKIWALSTEVKNKGK